MFWSRKKPPSPLIFEFDIGDRVWYVSDKNILYRGVVIDVTPDSYVIRTVATIHNAEEEFMVYGSGFHRIRLRTEDPNLAPLTGQKLTT